MFAEILATIALRKLNASMEALIAARCYESMTEAEREEALPSDGTAEDAGAKNSLRLIAESEHAEELYWLTDNDHVHMHGPTTAGYDCLPMGRGKAKQIIMGVLRTYSPALMAHANFSIIMHKLALRVQRGDEAAAAEMEHQETVYRAAKSELLIVDGYNVMVHLDMAAVLAAGEPA